MYRKLKFIRNLHQDQNQVDDLSLYPVERPTQFRIPNFLFTNIFGQIYFITVTISGHYFSKKNLTKQYQFSRKTFIEGNNIFDEKHF